MLRIVLPTNNVQNFDGLDVQNFGGLECSANVIATIKSTVKSVISDFSN